MTMERKRLISEWKSVSELRKVQRDISCMGYKKEYIESNRLAETKLPHCSNMITGAQNFFEPIEVKELGEGVVWRRNENHVHMDVPEFFETPVGVFVNHNNGEFSSWLGKDGHNSLLGKAYEISPKHDFGDFLVEGNYRDMFDCGEFSYAISNQMHMGLGLFKIIRVNKNIEIETVYDNYSNRSLERTFYEYLGRYERNEDWYVFASGHVDVTKDKREFRDKTILIKLGKEGDCRICNEWELSIAYINSLAMSGDYAFFGQNKMVTRLNIATGEFVYYTDKNDEELDALVEMY